MRDYSNQTCPVCDAELTADGDCSACDPWEEDDWDDDWDYDEDDDWDEDD